MTQAQPGEAGTGVRCQQMVGSGVVEYPCELPQGHDGPHYAIEDSGSRQRRRAWEDEQADLRAAQQAQTVQQPAQQPPVPVQEVQQPMQTAPPLAFDGGTAAVEQPNQVSAGVPVRLGDDVRMLLATLHGNLVTARDQKRFSNINWSVQAVEALRDVFDSRWRETPG